MRFKEVRVLLFCYKLGNRVYFKKGKISLGVFLGVDIRDGVVVFCLFCFFVVRFFVVIVGWVVGGGGCGGGGRRLYFVWVC